MALPEYMKYLRISIGDDYLSNSQITYQQLMASWGYGALPIAGVYGGGGAPEHSREIIQAPPESTWKAWYSGICTQPSRVVGGGEGWRRFMEWRTADSRTYMNKQICDRQKSDLGLSARIALSRG